MASNDPWDLGGGGDSFQFDRPGDAVEGFIVDMVDRQGTEIDTGEPAWWDEARTRPKMLKVLTLQTQLRDNPADDGKRNVTLAGSKNPWPDGGKSKMCAALTAVKAATGGQTAMRFNGWLRIEMVAVGPKTKPAYSPPKYFEALYRPPVMELDDQAGAQQAPQQQWTEQVQPGAFTQTQAQPQPQPGANWPQVAQQYPVQYPAQAAPPQAAPPQAAQPQFQQPVQQQPGPVAAGGTLSGEPITQADVEAIRKAGMRPEVVWGPDWMTRVVG